MTICAKCGVEYSPGFEPDPCVGLIAGHDVVSACCGHGISEHARVIFGDPPNRTRIVGPDAVTWLEAHGA